MNTYIKTDDIKMISALTTMGFEIKYPNGILKVIKSGGKEHLIFFITSESIDGKYKASEMIAAWNDPDFNDKNSDHYMAYLKTCFENESAILDMVKRQEPFYQINDGGKTMLIPANASTETQERAFNAI